MKYGVMNLNDDSIHSKYDDFEKARHTAVSLANWNIPVEIIDMETGEVLKHIRPYKELFDRPTSNTLVSS